MCVLSHSVMSNSVTLWTIAHQAPLSMRLPKQEYWTGLPFPSPGDFPNPGIKPMSPALQVDSLPPCHLGSSLSGSVAGNCSCMVFPEISLNPPTLKCFHLYLCFLTAWTAWGCSKAFGYGVGESWSAWNDHVWSGQGVPLFTDTFSWISRSKESRVLFTVTWTNPQPVSFSPKARPCLIHAEEPGPRLPARGFTFHLMLSPSTREGK